MRTKQILDETQVADLEHVTVVGRRKTGEFYYNSTVRDAPDSAWDMWIAIIALLKASGEL